MGLREAGFPLYEGTKQLYAKGPLTRKEYCDYRGWEVPANENPDDEGYLVEYVDGGKPNDERHEGYISWSPKDVFESHYHVIDDGEDEDGLEDDEDDEECLDD